MCLGTLTLWFAFHAGTCPYARAWVDVPFANNVAHLSAECSNAGTCDRKTGLCQCFPGYEGRACDRSKFFPLFFSFSPSLARCGVFVILDSICGDDWRSIMFGYLPSLLSCIVVCLLRMVFPPFSHLPEQVLWTRYLPVPEAVLR